MRYVMIVNPEAGTAERLASLLETLREHVDITVWPTKRSGHAAELAARAVAVGFDGVIAAGGDGTIHEVVNGIAPEFDRVRLAVLPLGTGNDFCRLVGASLDPEWLRSSLRSGDDQRFDLMKLDLGDGHSTYAVNTVSAGFGGVVTEKLDSDLKARYGPFAFVLGVRDALSELESYVASITLDEREVHHVTVAGIVLANGATIAGGLRIAPGAKADDGMLDVVVLEHAGALGLTALAARIATGEIAGSDSVTLFAASRVSILSDPPMPYSVDGELLESPPRAIELVPGVLRLATPGKDTPHRED